MRKKKNAEGYKHALIELKGKNMKVTAVNQMGTYCNHPNFKGKQVHSSKEDYSDTLKSSLVGLALLGASSVLTSCQPPVEIGDYIQDDDQSILVGHEQVSNTANSAKISKTASTSKNYNLSAEEIIEARKMGENMQDCLHGYTSKKDWNEFLSYIQKTNAQNVMYVLDGYNAESSAQDFFLQLSTEWVSHIEKAAIARLMVNFVNTYVNDNINKLDNDRQQVAKDVLAGINHRFKYINTNGRENSMLALDQDIAVLLSLFNIKTNN